MAGITLVFFAMGEARCIVAEQQGHISGVVGVAIRSLMLPDGGERKAAYVGDLKVDPAARGAFTLLRLAQAADAWARPQVTAAYGVVMDGTRASPSQYTGRANIPAFLKIGKVVVLRLATAIDAPDECQIVPASAGEARYRELSRGRYFATGGDPAERSELDPVWLIHSDGFACGRVEDTRRAKRLIDSDGAEMQSAASGLFRLENALGGRGRDSVGAVGTPRGWAFPRSSWPWPNGTWIVCPSYLGQSTK